MHCCPTIWQSKLKVTKQVMLNISVHCNKACKLESLGTTTRPALTMCFLNFSLSAEQFELLIRGAGNNIGKRGGGGGGAASRKRAPYFTLANKQKSLTLKNSLSLLNLYD